MQEAHDSTVELGDIEGSVLRLLISAMYGNYNPESPELLVPLFVAADAHQGADLYEGGLHLLPHLF